MVQISWEMSGVVRRFDGIVSGQEVMKSALAIQANPKFDDIRYVIHDFTNCTELNVDAETIELMIAHAAAATQGKARFRAVFIGNLPALKAMTEQFADWRVFKHPLQIVPTLDDARAIIAQP